MNMKLPLLDTDDAEMQPALRDVLEAGRREPERRRHLERALSPELARQVNDFRERVDCDAHLVWVGKGRAVAIIEPRDGGDLFLLGFDAFSFVEEGTQH